MSSAVSPAPTRSARRPFRDSKMRPGEGEREAGDGRRARPERRLGADALAALEGVHEEAVRDGAQRPGRRRDAVRLADLPEDLRLAEDHRVEARGDAEEVPDRRVAVPRERRLAQEHVVHAVEAREVARERVEVVLAVRHAVDLRAVARRDDRALGEDALVEEPLERLARLLRREGESLSQIERRAAVVPADEDEVHERKTCSLETNMLTAVYDRSTSTKPAIEKRAVETRGAPRRARTRTKR